ncbi:hypothetical protein [Sphingorhabdus sp. Alg239-R122]|uniref:hypothetical protein n=1 Tax=Sphingorhabdus sp. Alg239-R122 TaxID=2305989 RepID=UPI00196869FE|nr:hypothetical protein [Sphingorhabdus sp. Alg239-R122]
MMVMLPVSAYYIGSVSSSYHSEQNGYSQNETTATEQAVAQCRLEPNPTLEQCIAEQIKAGRDDYRSEQDLYAQRSMAQWAWWLLVISFAQIPLGFFGLIALIWTIRQGREGLGKAERANEIARDSAEKQLRAYVLVTSIEIVDVALDYKPIAKISLMNSGATVAQNVDMDIWFDLYPVDVEDKFLNPEHVEGTSKGPVAPGQSTGGFLKLRRMLDQRLFTAWERGDATLIFFGCVSYEDCFGVARKTQFRFICSSDKLDDNGQPYLIVAAKGNHAE